MGLDKDDTIVRRRMAQKMQFLAEDVAAAREPTSEELRAWFEKNGDKFALPSRVSFRHLYFGSDRRGERAHDDAVAALAKLAGQPQDAKLAAALADPFMFQDYYARPDLRASWRRSSGRRSRWRSRSSRRARGRGRSSPATAGTWSSSTPSFPGACPRSRRSSPT